MRRRAGVAAVVLSFAGLVGYGVWMDRRRGDAMVDDFVRQHAETLVNRQETLTNREVGGKIIEQLDRIEKRLDELAATRPTKGN